MIENSRDAVGKASVFIRQFLMFLDEDQKALREVQTHALNKAECSVPYASLLTKVMMNDGLIEREQIGRKYFVEITDAGVEFLEWAIENHYGVDAVIESDIEIPLDGCVIRNQLSKGNWRAVMEVKKQEKWLTVLVPKDHEVFIKRKDGVGKAKKLKEI